MHNIEWIWNIQNWIINLQWEIQSHTLSELKNILQDIRIQVADEAKQYLWHPSMRYRNPDIWTDESWFDCSGFITYILNKFWLSKPEIRHANEYFDSYGINIHREFVQPWDLIFFSKDWLVPKHIWIVISDTEYIHAPGKPNTFVEVKKIEDQIIEKSTPWKIYTYNPIWFKRIVLEIDKTKFNFNGNERKRRTKIV
jgi:hypothetical protein